MNTDSDRHAFSTTQPRGNAVQNGRRCFLAGTALALISSCLTGCGTLHHWTTALNKVGRKKPKEEDKGPKQDILVGVIDMVNPERRFVLIHAEAMASVSAGAVLESRSPSGSKAKLTVTPEKKMNFVSADITEGRPQQGDMVYMPMAMAGASGQSKFTMQPVTLSNSNPGGVPNQPGAPWHEVRNSPAPPPPMTGAEAELLPTIR